MAYRGEAPEENRRLFILSGKNVNEDALRKSFEHYGKIEDLWIVRDRKTNEEKGNRYLASVNTNFVKFFFKQK